MWATLKTKVLPLLQQTVQEWQKDNCLQMGTTLAYYALFSLFPLILVVLSIFGAFVGAGTAAREQILNLAREALPGQSQAFGVIENTLDNLNEASFGAGLIGFGTLLFAASGVFGALDQAFNVIWRRGPEQKPNAGIVAQALAFARQRFLAFSLVIGCALLVMVTMIASIAIETITTFVDTFTGGLFERTLLLQLLQLGVSLAILTLVLMLLFKYLPNERVAWGDVWLGALLTAAIFILLQRLIAGIGISVGANFQAYGAIGGVMALMLWIYLTSLILFMGGEFTFVYAYMFGSHRSDPQPAPLDAAQPAEPAPAPAPAASVYRAPARPTAPPDPLTAIGIGAIVGAFGALAVGVGALVMAVRGALRRVRGTVTKR